MADTLTAPPSSAPQGVTIVDTGPPKPPVTPPGEIRIGAIPPGAEPAPAPPKGSAKDRMFKEMRKKAGVQDDEANRDKPAPKIDDKPKSDTRQEPRTDEPDDRPSPADKPEDGKPRDRVSPWKLVDEYKSRAAQAEARIVELEKGAVPEAQRADWQKRMSEAESRAKALEDELRFTNYQKHPEFTEKYQKPYEEAWKKALGELNEISVTDTVSGQPRAVTSQDLLDLVNLPLGKARELADKSFGAFADDVMAHRKEIRNLFDAQQKALEEAKVSGSEREKNRAAQLQQLREGIQKQVVETWAVANKEAAEDKTVGIYFKPVEGNKEANERLEKGFAMVDDAFKLNPLDPRLKPEDRAAAIKKHAAVRNRAAAFGKLVYLNKNLESRLAALEQELSSYKGAVPTPGGRESAQSGGKPASAWERMRGELSKRVH